MNSNLVISAALLATGAVVASGASSHASPGSTLRLFIQDVAQSTADLGDKGPSLGDLFTAHGRVYTDKGGKEIGRFGGTCTTLSAAAGLPADASCVIAYILPKGRLFTQIVGNEADLVSGRPAVFGILGGTGAYSGARGDGTIAVPPDVPNLADAYLVFHLR